MTPPVPRPADSPLPDDGLSPEARKAQRRGITKVARFVAVQAVSAAVAVGAFFLTLFLTARGDGDPADAAWFQNAAVTASVVAFLATDLLGVGLIMAADRRPKRA